MGVFGKRWMWSGVFLLIWPLKVMAKALRAGFHLVIQRVFLRPVGPSGRRQGVEATQSQLNALRGMKWTQFFDRGLGGGLLR